MKIEERKALFAMAAEEEYGLSISAGTVRTRELPKPPALKKKSRKPGDRHPRQTKTRR